MFSQAEAWEVRLSMYCIFVISPGYPKAFNNLGKVKNCEYRPFDVNHEKFYPMHFWPLVLTSHCL